MHRLFIFAIVILLNQLLSTIRGQGNPKIDTEFNSTEQQTRTTSNPLSKENIVVQVSDKDGDEGDDQNRACFVCNYDTDGELCKQSNRSLLRASTCTKNDEVCKVWHFFSTNTDQRETYYFERGCADSCQPGCTSLDDMEHRFVSCFSCCADNLCNLDSNAPGLSSTYYLFISGAALWLFWYYRWCGLKEYAAY